MDESGIDVELASYGVKKELGSKGHSLRYAQLVNVTRCKAYLKGSSIKFHKMYVRLVHVCSCLNRAPSVV
jgi:hypothetical protein